MALLLSYVKPDKNLKSLSHSLIRAPMYCCCCPSIIIRLRGGHGEQRQQRKHVECWWWERQRVSTWCWFARSTRFVLGPTPKSPFNIISDLVAPLASQSVRTERLATIINNKKKRGADRGEEVAIRKHFQCGRLVISYLPRANVLWWSPPFRPT